MTAPHQTLSQTVERALLQFCQDHPNITPIKVEPITAPKNAIVLKKHPDNHTYALAVKHFPDAVLQLLKTELDSFSSQTGPLRLFYNTDNLSPITLNLELSFLDDKNCQPLKKAKM